MIITEQKIESALAFMYDRAEEYGKARAAHEWAEKNEKVVLARLMSLSDAKTVSAKDTEARDQERHSWLDGPANDYGRDERLFQLLDQIHKEKGMG